jgi:hypothetical protein
MLLVKSSCFYRPSSSVHSSVVPPETTWFLFCRSFVRDDFSRDVRVSRSMQVKGLLPSVTFPMALRLVIRCIVLYCIVLYGPFLIRVANRLGFFPECQSNYWIFWVLRVCKTLCWPSCMRHISSFTLLFLNYLPSILFSPKCDV